MFATQGRATPHNPFTLLWVHPTDIYIHQEAVLVTRRAERCGVVYPVEMWPACSTGFPIRSLRSAGAQHLRFVRPMKSLTPAILVSIMARGSFKSKLIFFVLVLISGLSVGLWPGPSSPAFVLSVLVLFLPETAWRMSCLIVACVSYWGKNVGSFF